MKTRRTQPWLIIAVIAIAAPILSGCSGASTVLTASWPGLAVENNTIYLSYAKVYALGLDGTPKWSFPDSNHQLQSGQAFFAPPASDDKLVVVSDYTDSVFGLDPVTGQQQWIFKTNKSRIIGGPVLSDKLVYAASADGILHAIDRSGNGGLAKEVWSFVTEASIWSTPLLDNGTLYVTSMDKHVYAVDADTGKLKWKYPDSDSAPENPPLGGIVGAPTLHKGILYFSSFNNRLYALDTETHKIVWRYQTDNWVWGSPVVEDSTGYVIAADLNGNIFAIDPAHPDKPVWHFTAKAPPNGVHASVVGTPTLRTLADGTPVIYVGTDSDPDLYVLKVKDGTNALAPKTYWYHTPTTFLFWETGGNNPDLPIKIYASPVLNSDPTSNTMYLATSEGPNALYIVDSNTLEYKNSLKPIATKDVDAAILAKAGQPQQDTGLLGNPQTLLFMLLIFLVVTFVLRPGQQGGKK